MGEISVSICRPSLLVTRTIIIIFKCYFCSMFLIMQEQFRNLIEFDKFVRVKEEIVIIEFRSTFFFRYKRIFVSLRNFSFVQQNDL